MEGGLFSKCGSRLSAACIPFGRCARTSRIEGCSFKKCLSPKRRAHSCTTLEIDFAGASVTLARGVEIQRMAFWHDSTVKTQQSG
eukprot:6741954-Pyramimonas_sp.AAC.1